MNFKNSFQEFAFITLCFFIIELIFYIAVELLPAKTIITSIIASIIIGAALTWIRSKQTGNNNT